MAKYKINKEKCIGCGVCTVSCDGGTKLGTDGKAEVVDEAKLEKCKGETVCPYGAIEKTE